MAESLPSWVLYQVLAKLFYANQRPLDIIGPNYLKSINLGIHQ